MDAEKELKLKKVVFWELLAVAVLVLALVVALLVSGVKRKAPDETGSQQTGTSESLSSSASDTTTDTTDTTTDTTETTGETTETTETTEETTEETEETTEESVEQPSEETTEESEEQPSQKPSEKPEEPSEEESKEPEPSQPPATDPTLPPPAANPIRPEDIVKNGDYLTCQTAPTVVGIDVSEWQGSQIDWAQVKAAGIEFVMIRVGWRGNTSGKLNADEHAQRNYQGASAAGLKIGAYFFSQAINVTEAENEAAFLLDAIKDWKLDMPVVFDWEYAGADARTGSVTARTLTDCAKAFCNKIAAAGFKPMVYFGANHARDRLYLSELTDYDFWFAQYNDTLDYPYKVDMWQYTNKGSVPGIPTNVDINLYFPWEE